MHTEVLTGRTQQKFFNPDEAENFYYFGTYDVDFNKRTNLDVIDMTAAEANKEIDNLMSQGYGTIVIKNPQGKHSIGVGILNKLNLIFEGSLGYFGIGSCDGPTVRINGRVGWFCAENLMAGKVVIEKNAGSCFGAAIRGGDLICNGSDAVDAELTKSDQDWLKRKLKVAEIGENFNVSKMKKIVAGKKLWNYDNLEPTEKKGAI